MRNTITIRVETDDETFYDLTKKMHDDERVNLSKLLKGREGVITSVEKETSKVWGVGHRPIGLAPGEGKIEIIA